MGLKHNLPAFFMFVSVPRNFKALARRRNKRGAFFLENVYFIIPRFRQQNEKKSAQRISHTSSMARGLDKSYSGCVNQALIKPATRKTDSIAREIATVNFALI